MYFSRMLKVTLTGHLNWDIYLTVPTIGFRKIKWNRVESGDPGADDDRRRGDSVCPHVLWLLMFVYV